MAAILSASGRTQFEALLPSDERDRRALVGFALFVTLVHCFGTWLAFVSAQAPPRIPGAWLNAGATFVLMSLFWRGVVPRRDRGKIAVMGLFAALSASVINVALGEDLLTSLRVGGALLAQGVVLAVLYASLRRACDRSRLPKSASGAQSGTQPPTTWYDDWRAAWVPRDGLDLVCLAFAGFVAAVVAGTLGAAPGRELFGGDLPHGAMYVSNLTVTTFIGLATVMLAFRWPGRDLRGHRLLMLLILSATSAFVIVKVLQTETLPLSWIVVIPSLIGGALLSPLAASLQCFFLAVAALAAANTQVYLDSWSSTLATDATLHALIGVTVLVELTWSLAQQERTKLLDDLRTERAQATDQAEMLETVMTSMSDAAIITDRVGRWSYHNPATAPMIGLEQSGLVPGVWPERVTLVTRAGRRINSMEGLRALWNGSDLVELVEIDDPERETRMLQLALREVRHQGQERYVVLLRDVTEQLEREAALRSFAKVAAHDLKGPLTSVSGWVSLALEEADPDSEIASMLERAAGGSVRLRRIIDDWLQYSVVREGQLELAPVHLGDLLSEVARGLLIPDENGVLPVIEIDADVVAFVDATLARQLVSNLLGNAIKYRRRDTAALVQVTAQLKDGDPAWVRVDVVDNGIGVPTDEVELIFDMFGRASSVVDHYDGSGIGLSVCRDIVHRHGGTIRATRNAEHGSTFTFTLPTYEGLDADGSSR